MLTIFYVSGREPLFFLKRSTLSDACSDATVDIALWSQTEQGLGITAGSLATLRPLLRLVLSKIGLTGGNASETPPSGVCGATPQPKHPSCLPHFSHASRKGPRELYSLGTITRHEETEFGQQSAAKELYDQDADEYDEGDYRIQITPPHPSRGASLRPEMSSVSSQEQLQDVRSYV